jgi:Phage tail assembly chaperone protein
MLDCDQLAWLLAKEYPQLTKCVDYWVAHPVDQKTHEQVGPAWIVTWTRDDPPIPLADDIERMWAKYGDECTRFSEAVRTRRERDTRLTEADHLVNRALDQGNTDLEATARTYRQALRDVPQQAGFPLDIHWPEPPS